jgi:hypothetical protein
MFRLKRDNKDLRFVVVTKNVVEKYLLIHTPGTPVRILTRMALLKKCNCNFYDAAFYWKEG